MTQKLQLEGIENSFMDYTKMKSEDTLIFAEMMTRLLASVDEAFTSAGVPIEDQDVQELTDYINAQINEYKKKGSSIEIIPGLKITAVIATAIDKKDLKFKFFVEKEGNLYRCRDLEPKMKYLGHHNGEDLWLDVEGYKLKIRNSQNPKTDIVVGLNISQMSGAVEARKRLESIAI